MPVEPTTVPHTIVLKGELSERHEEDRAGAAINPGYLLKRTNTGTVVKHATAGGGGPNYFAKEDELKGKTINDAYASGDVCFYHIAQPGDMINCRVAAAATAITMGAPVTSAGDGTMKLATGSDVLYGTAKEAVDNSGGGAEVFLKIEIN